MTAKYTKFFERFPKLKYDVEQGPVDKYETVTDIFYRIGFLRTVLTNTDLYSWYEVEPGETPEIIAEKIYNDVGVGWIILYVNQMVDPQFDWHLTDEELNKYIIAKYGSLEYAQSNYHHYEKIVKRTNQTEKVTTVDRYYINGGRLTDNQPSAPFDYYSFDDSLGITADSDKQRVDYNLRDHFTADANRAFDRPGLSEYATYYDYEIAGKTVEEETSGESITFYDYEVEENEKKKLIKIISPTYYNQIMTEFNNFTRNNTRYTRALV